MHVADLFIYDLQSVMVFCRDARPDRDPSTVLHDDRGESITKVLMLRRWSWLGHVLPMDESRTVNTVNTVFTTTTTTLLYLELLNKSCYNLILVKIDVNNTSCNIEINVFHCVFNSNSFFVACLTL